MQFREWNTKPEGWCVYDHLGRECGDIYSVQPSGNYKFSHMAEAYDPINLDADDLREIADKLDELNCSEV